jgi:hypothetical protein
VLRLVREEVEERLLHTHLSIRVIIHQIKVLLHRFSIDVDDSARGSVITRLRGNGLGSSDDLGPLSRLELVGDSGDRRRGGYKSPDSFAEVEAVGPVGLRELAGGAGRDDELPCSKVVEPPFELRIYQLIV